MLKGEDWKDVYNLISTSTAGLNQMDNFLTELCKCMQLQINEVKEENKKIKRQLNKIKKQLNNLKDN